MQHLLKILRTTRKDFWHETPAPWVCALSIPLDCTAAGLGAGETEAEATAARNAARRSYDLSGADDVGAPVKLVTVAVSWWW